MRLKWITDGFVTGAIVRRENKDHSAQLLECKHEPCPPCKFHAGHFRDRRGRMVIRCLLKDNGTNLADKVRELRKRLPEGVVVTTPLFWDCSYCTLFYIHPSSTTRCKVCGEEKSEANADSRVDEVFDEYLAGEDVLPAEDVHTLYIQIKEKIDIRDEQIKRKEKHNE
jgi:hypothetical protein